LLFPKIFGTRLANEILLTDRWVTAQEAVDVGFANGMIDTFDPKSDFIDPDMIPCIPKLLKTDYRTLVNCMEQLNASKDLDEIEKVTRREAQALIDTWKDPEFAPKMFKFMKQLGMKAAPKAKM